MGAKEENGEQEGREVLGGAGVAGVVGREGFAEGPTQRLLKQERESPESVWGAARLQSPQHRWALSLGAVRRSVRACGTQGLTGKEVGSRAFEQRGGVISPTFLKAPLWGLLQDRMLADTGGGKWGLTLDMLPK